MLSFFPTPYPDELWYSVLCRYHVRAGSRVAAATFRQLFSAKVTASVGGFFPNNLIYTLTKNLPDEIFDIRDIVLNHTLFKYHCRINSKEEKEDMLNDLCYGKLDYKKYRGKLYGSKQNKLNFCPVCKEEDYENYGESYWHLSHQIPGSNICIKHKCYLVPFYIRHSDRLSEHFILPDDYNEEYKVNYNILNYELHLARTFNDYLHLPLLAGPTEGYSNLYQGLLNKGYGVGLNNYGWTINSQRLHEDLVECFSAEIVTNVFGECLSTHKIGGIKKWEFRIPERYVLLSAFINQKAEVTFGLKIEDEFALKLLAMSAKNKLMLSSRVKSILGISTKTLEKLPEYYDIKPFWVENLDKRTVAVKFTRKEKEIVVKYYKEKGYETGTQFFRECIMKVVNFS